MNKIMSSMKQLQEIIDLKDYYSKTKQKKLLEEISKNPSGLKNLLDLLISRKSNNNENISDIDGTIFKFLYNSKVIKLEKELYAYFEKGIVSLESDKNINYIPLYKSLISNNFKKANQLTQIYLKELAGLDKDNKRTWLYFTDILNLPIKDLRTIDLLWRIYSEDRFGFSIQRQIWVYNNKNWEKFWNKIGWKSNQKNMRYPDEFIWDGNAPNGHLPLSNQLRGVQVLTALFMHPALKTTINKS